MGLHRVTTTSGSAADARFRSDTQQMHFYDTDYYSCNISPNPNATRTTDQYLRFPVTRDHARHTSISYSSDPTQPLLPTTRLHSLPSPSSPPDIGCEPTSYEAEYHRMSTKSASGMYIGLLCIAIVWLLPLGIIVSGATSGEVAAKVSSLFERLGQMPFLDSTSSEPLAWDSLRRGEHCLRYKTREYTAKSLSPGHGRDALQECRRSSAKIHNIELEPTFCEDLGLWSGIWAHWVVDFDEPDCETRWTEFKDEGCQGTAGRHRFTAKLDHFNRDDDWQIMCSTTPTEYALQGKRLPVPQRCNRVKDIVIGIWDMPDRSCPPSKTPES